MKIIIIIAMILYAIGAFFQWIWQKNIEDKITELENKTNWHEVQPTSEARLKADMVVILDKIKAEIEHLTYYWSAINPKSVIDDVLEIIDKYRAESEDKE